MNVEQIIDKFIKYPSALGNGAGSLSKRWNSKREDIYEARKIVKNRMKFGTDYHPKDVAFNKVKLPKIVLFDIETSPSISFTWKRFKENISIDQVIQDPIMLTWSAKILYSDEILSDKITAQEVVKFDDKRIVTSLWKVLDDADIVIGHYSDHFDIPMLNSRAVINGLAPYTPITSIDTKAIASRNFRFPSNKLDALGSYFGVGQKIKTEFSLWRRCIMGDVIAIDEMCTYNKQDVVLLEEVYLKLRPWTKAHPNVAMYIDSTKTMCSHCGSEDVTKIDKPYYTQTNKYDVYRCKCGALSRGRKSIIDIDKRDSLLVSTGK